MPQNLQNTINFVNLQLGFFYYFFVIFRSFIEERYFRFWNYEEMYWCLWAYVVKSQTFIVFVDDVSFDFFVDYFFENCTWLFAGRFGLFLLWTKLKFLEKCLFIASLLYVVYIPVLSAFLILHSLG